MDPSMLKKKGKEGTKGAKLIAKENVETLTFYRNMILGANGIYFMMRTILGSTYGAFDITMFVLCAISYIGSWQFMNYCGKPKQDASGNIVDSGIDLNSEMGICEHVKDIIIFTAAIQVLAMLTNYIWFLLLLIPLRAFWMLWKNVIGPWIFAPPQEPEVNEKKQAKLDRKMKRMQAMR